MVSDYYEILLKAKICSLFSRSRQDMTKTFKEKSLRAFFPTSVVTFLKSFHFVKIDGVGPVDNRPSPDSPLPSRKISPQKKYQKTYS